MTESSTATENNATKNAESDSVIYGHFEREKTGIFAFVLRSMLCAIMPLVVFLACILLACLLAYLLVTVAGVDAASYRSVVKKASQLFLVLSVFPAMYFLKLTRSDIGFAAKPLFFKQLFQGASLGFVTLLPVFILFYVLGINVVDTTQPWTPVWVIQRLVIEFLLALLISLFEEPIFRGVLLTALSRKLPVAAAVSVSALYYASLHFLDTKTQLALPDLHWYSGFMLLGVAVRRLLSPEILPAFFALFAVGLFLGVLRTQASLNLGLCIGCHACWVWLIKLSKIAFNTNPDSAYLYLVSSYDGVIGPFITLWLSLAIFIYLVFRYYLNKKIG